MTFTQTVVLEQGRHRLGENSIGIFGDADVGRRRSLAYPIQIALA